MICEDCRLGADLAAGSKGQASEVEFARERHALCKGCDCQHDVDGQLSGKVIQR